MKCFIVQSEYIKRRIDPYYYRPEFIELVEQFKNSKYQVKSLTEISAKITSGATPKSGGAAYTTKEKGIPFITF